MADEVSAGAAPAPAARPPAKGDDVLVLDAITKAGPVAEALGKGGVLGAALLLLMAQAWYTAAQITTRIDEVVHQVGDLEKAMGEQTHDLSTRLAAVEQRIAVEQALRDAEERQRERQAPRP